MTVGAIIFLVVLLLIFIGGFAFFIAMDYRKDKEKKEKPKTKKKK